MEENNQFQFNNLENILQLANQNMSRLIQSILSQFPAQSPTLSSLSVVNSTASGTTIKVGSGYLMAIAITTPSTGLTGLIYDANSPANVSSSNIMTLIPSSGNVLFGYPFANGLTVQPSTSGTQRVSVYYI